MFSFFGVGESFESLRHRFEGFVGSWGGVLVGVELASEFSISFFYILVCGGFGDSEAGVEVFGFENSCYVLGVLLCFFCLFSFFCCCGGGGGGGGGEERLSFLGVAAFSIQALFEK